ncbi:MAG: sulfurtransferase TusA family protein [Candidatus Hodarchaeota archaeon]
MLEDLTNIKGDVVVDARAESCPGPLLAAKKQMTKVSENGILEVWSADPGTKRDIPLWSKKVGHEYIGDIEEKGYFRIFVRRKR